MTTRSPLQSPAMPAQRRRLQQSDRCQQIDLFEGITPTPVWRDLPEETRLYVLAVTGRPVEDWAAPRAGLPAVIGAGREPCLSVTADLAGWAPAQATPTHRALAAWQVRLDTYLARSVAFRQQPPGTVPVAERNRAAAVMCDRIRAMGMPCAVYQH